MVGIVEVMVVHMVVVEVGVMVVVVEAMVVGEGTQEVEDTVVERRKNSTVLVQILENPNGTLTVCHDLRRTSIENILMYRT